MKQQYISGKRLSLWIRLTKKWNTLYKQVKEQSTILKIKRLNALSLRLGVKRKLALVSMAGFITLGAQAQVQFEPTLLDDNQTFPSLGLLGYANPVFVDLDSDGDQDLVIGDTYTQIKYYTNNGNNVFTEELDENNPFSDIELYRNAPTFADVDGDGDLDLVLGKSTAGLNYYTNDNLTFTEQTGANNPFNSLSISIQSSPVLGDIDNDGVLDLIVGERSDGLALFLNNSGVFTEQTGTTDPFDSFNFGFNVAPELLDWDSDGDLDIVGSASNGSFYFENNGDDTFTRLLEDNPFKIIDPETATSVGVGFVAYAFLDADEDGDLDVFAGTSSGNLEYLENDQSEVIEGTDPTNLSFDVLDAGYASYPSFSDINGDGVVDLFIGLGDRTSISVYDGSTDFTLLEDANNPFDEFDVGTYVKPTFIDLDNDGDDDLVLGRDIDGIKYFVNTNSVFTEQTGIDNPFSGIDDGYRPVPCFADLDSDGDQDLILGDYFGEITYYTNENNVFTEQTGNDNPFSTLTHSYISALTLVDFDEDGDLDLVTGDYYGDIRYFQNENNVFAEQIGDSNPFDDLYVGGNVSMAFADLDNDGDLDLYLGSNSGRVFEFKNSSNTPTGILFNNDEVESLSIFPNPATSIINTEEGQLEVSDAIGNLVLSTESNGQVDVSSLEAGIYVVTQNRKRTKLIVE